MTLVDLILALGHLFLLLNIAVSHLLVLVLGQEGATILLGFYVLGHMVRVLVLLYYDGRRHPAHLRAPVS